MTEQTSNDVLNDVQMGPLVRLVRANQEDYEITFSALLETTGADHDPALISDGDMQSLMAEHLDLTQEQLVELVYGEGRSGTVKVERRETGNVVMRPETRLGVHPWKVVNWE